MYHSSCLWLSLLTGSQSSSVHAHPSHLCLVATGLAGLIRCSRTGPTVTSLRRSDNRDVQFLAHKETKLKGTCYRAGFERGRVASQPGRNFWNVFQG